MNATVLGCVYAVMCYITKACSVRQCSNCKPCCQLSTVVAHWVICFEGYCNLLCQFLAVVSWSPSWTYGRLSCPQSCHTAEMWTTTHSHTCKQLRTATHTHIPLLWLPSETAHPTFLPAPVASYHHPVKPHTHTCSNASWVYAHVLTTAYLCGWDKSIKGCLDLLLCCSLHLCTNSNTHVQYIDIIYYTVYVL